MDDAAIEGRALALLEEALGASGPILFLTGAGVSAESGLPTFRGPEGYWTVGSREYRPEQLATYEAFRAMPEEVWAWYLYRRGVYRAARPNAAHLAITEAEHALGDRFLLVSQNVDGLHERAGTSLARTYQIHGNVEYCRCDDEAPRVRALHTALPLDWPKARKIGAAESELLRCCAGEGWSRPHVLFFDEYYDEELFRWQSTLDATARAAMVVVVGTSGATNLPTQVVTLAARRDIPLLVINRDESPFTHVADRVERGLTLRGQASEWLPRIVRGLVELTR